MLPTGVCSIVARGGGQASIVTLHAGARGQDPLEEALSSCAALSAICGLKEGATLRLDLLDADGAVVVDGAKNFDAIELHLRAVWGLPAMR